MKNKCILLSLLIYLSSTEVALAEGNLTRNVIDRIHHDMAVRSAMTSPVCFYYENYFQGERFCLNPPEVIDFTKENNLQIHANKIKSINIPKSSQITVYQGEHFFTLTDSILQVPWQKMIAVDDVTEIFTTDKKPLNCDTNCIITQKMVIPLSRIFSYYMSDSQYQEKSVLLSFEIHINSFNIGINNFLDITVDDGLVLIQPPNSQQIDFVLHKDATHISFLLSWFENELILSYVETADGELLHSSPIVSMSPSHDIHQEEMELIIFNSDDRQPLTLQKVLMATHREPHRTKRGTAGIVGCFLSGPLALYNLVTQGRCNQVESAWRHIKAIFAGHDASDKVVVGTGEPLKPKPVETSVPPEQDTPTLALTQINTQLHNQSLTLPAVSRFCQKSLDTIINNRYPRQASYSCSTWLSAVLTDFTLLFGSSLRTWSTEYLIQTINGILDRRAIDNDNDAIDAFIHSPVAGNRLIQTLTDVAEEQGRSALINSITQTFTYAEQNYAQYAASSRSQGASHLPNGAQGASHGSDGSYDSFDENDLYDSCDSEDGSSSRSDVAPPQQAQQYPLGSYQMPISSYAHQDILPRILRNGEWIVPQERFDIEVIQGPYTQNRRSLYALLEAIAQWENIYIEKPVQCNRRGLFPTDMDTNRYAGRVTSRLIKSYAQYQRHDQIIVVVRFNQQIVSVSTANTYFVDGSAERTHAVIGATITNPAYVLNPQAEGTIRGAGSAALHATIQHLQASGVTELEAEVISTPSAVIKKRIGFVFVPNKYGMPLPTPSPTR
ncbi:N-acetyltransferase GCN5 [Yersinia mollaretii]|nr:N-acetyltransferase GCN5 [Yersinia mollaretii]